MIGTLTTPMMAKREAALAALRSSSMALCKLRYPIYKNNKMSSEVRRASHTHQAPQVGFPQRAPVHKAIKVMRAPVMAILLEMR